MILTKSHGFLNLHPSPALRSPPFDLHCTILFPRRTRITARVLQQQPAFPMAEGHFLKSSYFSSLRLNQHPQNPPFDLYDPLFHVRCYHLALPPPKLKNFILTHLFVVMYRSNLNVPRPTVPNRELPNNALPKNHLCALRS
ncbi:S-adenosylmethionine decarboxylase proenzyme [Psidium guajava]|nr:S-adenosylmethionine decarboxylase proenzyme [Psidium guajava]